MKEQDRLWILIARQLTGEATEEELQELQKLLQETPDISYPMQVLSNLWKPTEPKDAEESENAFTRHHQRMALREATREANYFAHHFDARGRTIRERWKNRKDLFKNHFKSSFRNLARNKSFSLINISGLAIGMASAIIILLWIQLQLSYDQFHKNKDRIYQLYNRIELDGKIQCWGATPMVMAPILKSSYPQVEETARLNWVGAFTLGEGHLQTQGYITDPGFLKIFSFPLVAGDPNTALNAQHAIVLTEKMARKLFGTTQVLGRTLRVDSNAHFTVTGVLKDLPDNTEFNSFEYLIPWSYMKEVHWETSAWGNNYIRTYVLLKPGVSEKTANEQFRTIIQTHSDGLKNEIFVHPMRKWWLYSEFKDGRIAGGQIETVRLFGVIAGFILLIACINYMNLSTARSQKRAREVGIRKVIGAAKASLIRQFMSESILISFLAGILALLILQPGLQALNRITEPKMTVPYTHLYFWAATLGFILLTGIVAGSYPAFYLSGFRPMSVLKGNFKGGHALENFVGSASPRSFLVRNLRSPRLPRKVLVVFQFTFAIILITCTVIIYRQIGYSRGRDLGYDRDNLFFVYIKGDIKKNYPLIKEELMQSGAITSITRTNSPITDIWTTEDSYEWAGKDPKARYIFYSFLADNHFARTMGLNILAGRDISADRYPEDSAAVLLNESAAKLTGLKNPIGETISNHGRKWRIVGVVNDFIPGSPYDPIEPIIIRGPDQGFGTVSFKLNEKNSRSANLKKIGGIFKKYNPDYVFDYKVVEDVYAESFRGAKQIEILAAVFSGLTIFISCLGLFALAAYMAENRIKEIGVRKVLGASVSGIATLLSKDFLKLVLISFVIASPLAGWAMYTWLQNFPYHIRISWWIFALTGLLTVLITLATVSSQAIRAALTNPADSLRTE
ncbi:MAG TPA: ABC transporter permease [Puia sp.]|nr:ABC transporter permease [Puia sp.]